MAPVGFISTLQSQLISFSYTNVMYTHKPIPQKWIYRKLEGEKAFIADRLDFNNLTHRFSFETE
jgi:hypothetical protein